MKIAANFCLIAVPLLAAVSFAPLAAGESAEGAGSTQEFEKANQKMHDGVTMTFTGDADVDFVTGMIPHHQGAIDMAKVQLKYGKDPEIRKLAEDIVRAQEDEINLMNAWLANRRAGAVAPAAKERSLR